MRIWRRSVRSFLCLLIVGLVLCSIHVEQVAAQGVSDTYNYSYSGTTVDSPAAYKATLIVDGEDLRIGALNEPSDIFVNEEQSYCCFE